MTESVIIDIAELAREDEPERAVLALLTVKPGKVTDKGKEPDKVLPILPNLTTILEQDSRWAGRLRYNEFTCIHLCDDEAMTDVQESAIAEWLARVYGIYTPTARIGEAIRLVASRRSFHPLREHLGSLIWDGKVRAPSLLSQYFKAADVALHAAMGTAFLVGAVARIFEPGCKLDTMLILVGPQGSFKSTAVEVLAGRPEWYSNTPIAIGHKDALQDVSGVWMIEFSELESLRDRRQSTVKAFLSSAVDRFRPPYGRNTETRPRQVVFVATSNPKSVLDDATGSRRFWPVEVGTVDIGSLQRDRDQLWAEAVVRYRRGERWHLSGDLEEHRIAAAEDFAMPEPWEVPVLAYAAQHPEGVSVEAIFEHALHMPRDRQKPKDAQRVAAILQRAGAKQTRSRDKAGARGRVWRLPEQDPPAEGS